MEAPKYNCGLGNYLRTEALTGALPEGQNSPQAPAYGLYAEQISGTAFTVKRASNRRTWLYRILPSAKHEPFVACSLPNWKTRSGDFCSTPNQLRWLPSPPAPAENFWTGVTTLASTHSDHVREGVSIHLYSVSEQTSQTVFYNSDAEMIFIPYAGHLMLRTELGVLDLAPQEIAVIPRGIKMQVLATSAHAQGYLAENFGSYLRLPELGVIGANGLAEPRDFIIPTAAFEDDGISNFTLITRFQSQFFATQLTHSPFDVVAWQGNYYPYKYDLRKFNTINTVSFDHPDPSIFTVLTSPSQQAGVANLDLVVFPPRWMVAEHSFRPPYYHRNIMSEFMGLISGQYDAKSGQFAPGGASLHNAWIGHGPDTESFQKGLKQELKPFKYQEGLAFMLESCFPYLVSHAALASPTLDVDYHRAWDQLPRRFSRTDVEK